jgi:hypothetical protein
MDIMFTIDGIHILANVVIVDLIHVNLVLWIASYSRMAMTIQANIMSYYNQHLEDDFIPLAYKYLDVYTNK